MTTRRIEIRQWERQLEKPNVEGKPASPEARAFRKVIEVDDEEPCATCDVIGSHPRGSLVFMVERDVETGTERIHYSRGLGLNMIVCRRMSIEEAIEIFEHNKDDGTGEFWDGFAEIGAALFGKRSGPTSAKGRRNERRKK